ncbi:Tet(A)/Tet(B)/Tet(C) family tetracycline efflux MFS transporter [Phyllobacterium meliloti]|uniref:Tet(A)/Tet(B)/Tet(C) family tetracycline efflux MFS transporter n=1 Tax=Phyllobacterium meliloti TaxID=555317 RepID=UPI000DD4F0F6|nr:Tet(A)/Tet(B)/Tet(C) family tetracycline efflux MFS transporter [Phyllobacterium sp. T1293]UGX85089.1 Tet(A)/Tet(B)/Tet(C) family tetracycline efflux MFS transporter [Phyllobacterium sp. T1293]
MTFNKPLTVILTTVTLDAIGIGMIMPVLPRLLTTLAHSDNVARHYGVLLALYALMQFVFAPLLGALSDRFGRRPVILGSLAGAALDYLVMAFATVLPLLYIGRIISGVTGATMSVASATIADITPEQNRAKRFGMIGACFGLGFIAGPLLGGIAGGFGVHYPFLLAMALNGLNFLFALFFLPETSKGEKTPFSLRSLNPIGSFQWITSIKTLTPLVAMFTLLQLVGQLPGALWIIYTQDQFLWSVSTVGISLAAFGLLHALVQGMLTGPVTGKIGEKRTLVLGMATDCIGYLLMAFATQSWMVAPILFFLSMGGIATPALQSIITRQVDASKVGEVQGVLASATSLAGIIGPVIFTTIYAATRTDWSGLVWVCGAALYVLCIPMLRVVAYRHAESASRA